MLCIIAVAIIDNILRQSVAVRMVNLFDLQTSQHRLTLLIIIKGVLRVDISSMLVKPKE
jgi:hypothetical protein